MKEKIKEVYVVITGCYGDEGIDSIHSTPYKAERRVKEINSTHWGRSTTPYIERWEVN